MTHSATTFTKKEAVISGWRATLAGEIAGGLDGLDLDGLRVHRSLVGQSDGDGLVGDTTEQLAGLGHLGGDLDGSALDGGLSGDGVLAG